METDRNREEQKKTLMRWIAEAKRAVFFGGAGVSTASGIPDFRSEGGLYDSDPDAERMFEIDFYRRHPGRFWELQRKYVIKEHAEPNRVHRFLADWERKGGLAGIVTQNIDGLHQAAGSRAVAELHGTMATYHCPHCLAAATAAEIAAMPLVPVCTCGGVFRPDIVMFGESLPADAFEQAVAWIARTDLLIVAGTSLVVYPAAGLIHGRPRGSRLVILNRTATPYDDLADLRLGGELVDLFPEALPS